MLPAPLVPGFWAVDIFWAERDVVDEVEEVVLPNDILDTPAPIILIVGKVIAVLIWPI